MSMENGCRFDIYGATSDTCKVMQDDCFRLREGIFKGTLNRNHLDYYMALRSVCSCLSKGSDFFVVPSESIRDFSDYERVSGRYNIDLDICRADYGDHIYSSDDPGNKHFYNYIKTYIKDGDIVSQITGHVDNKGDDLSYDNIELDEKCHNLDEFGAYMNSHLDDLAVMTEDFDYGKEEDYGIR